MNDLINTDPLHLEVGHPSLGTLALGGPELTPLIIEAIAAIATNVANSLIEKLFLKSGASSSTNINDRLLAAQNLMDDFAALKYLRDKQIPLSSIDNVIDYQRQSGKLKLCVRNKTGQIIEDRTYDDYTMTWY